METMSLLFEEKPRNWGLRGDPILWDMMKDRLRFKEIPEWESVIQLIIEEKYYFITGQNINDDEFKYNEKFDNDGISGGHCSPEFWRTKAIPQIIKNFQKYQGL